MLYAFFDDFQFSLFPQLSSFTACEESHHLIILYPPVPRTHNYWRTLSLPITMVAPPLVTMEKLSSLFLIVPSLTPYDLPFPQNGGSICPNTRMAISLQRVIRSTSCLFQGRVFGDGGSNGAIYDPNPRWRPPPCWKNFKWRYLRNRSSDPLHVWLQGGVFWDG